MKKVYKVIIDTDPGVDDTHALMYVLNDPQFDIKLFSVAYGNIKIENATRNLCHILDLLNKDIPVVQGCNQRMSGSTEDASFLHTVEGLGGYVPPKTATRNLLEKDAADAVYEVLKKYPKEITYIVLGPHTNLANLLIKHPDAKDLIKKVLMMGGAPMGIQANPNHNSFNIRTDAPAFEKTIQSNLPIVMVPSSIGRDEAYLTEEMVKNMEQTNDVGKFLTLTFETYWEPNYEDARIATNDLAAVYYLTHPNLYKTRRANIHVDINTGKTTPTFTRKGQFKIVVGLKRKKFLKLIFKKLQEMNNIKLDFSNQEKKIVNKRQHRAF